MIKGIDVELYERTQTGEDQFGAPIYEEIPTTIPNVLVSPVDNSGITTELTINSGKAVYTLAIPKGDTHEWRNCKVKFFDQLWKVSGTVVEGIEANIPLFWHKKVTVERYE